MRTTHPHADPTLVLTRRLPLDLKAICAESGLKRGKIARSAVFDAWGVFNTYGDEGADFCIITPPPLTSPETTIAIDGSDWCFYAPKT